MINVEICRATQPLVPGGGAAGNRGADYVKYFAPALRVGTRYLTGHRAPHNQASLACTAHDAGQHRDSKGLRFSPNEFPGKLHKQCSDTQGE
jgi:hypothetical protein